ncbi:AAA family ATPase [Methylobacterium fujisawaense]|uniref:AAA family ATPase n=1 Tax=Methylobacterium fujisawaense TaxID=107400 RepID=UPI002446CC8C|nr:AAA family ATPase [Methylobacterium fujisawaense]MDH3031055.1 AAA family ATPase [Methylobacterium fujisawaense]
MQRCKGSARSRGRRAKSLAFQPLIEKPVTAPNWGQAGAGAHFSPADRLWAMPPRGGGGSLLFSFEQFRSFQNSGDINLLPLNLLIGENSAGKTSFLAGCRLMVELMRGASTASFNKDPFFLGSFDQIAHFRGGKGGRAPLFTIRAQARVRKSPIVVRSREDANEIRSCTLSITFQNKYSQPAIKTIDFNDGHNYFTHNSDNSIDVFFGDKELKITGQKMTAYENITFPAETSLFSIALFRRTMMVARSMISSSARSSKSRDNDAIDGIRNLEGYLLSFRNYFSRRVFASAPVRTRPDRIYSPTELTPSPEGNHTPNSLIRLKRFSPDEWEQIKNQLELFGSASGLYNSIDLKSLGKSGSDPFQLMISNGGPQRNLMDVGYGVSQSIPIVAEVLSSKISTLFLFQQPEVHLHPRAQAALGTFFAENVAAKKGNITLVETHSDFMLDRIRYEIKQGNLDHRQVQILYFTKGRLDTHIDTIKYDKSGNLINIPKGYREFFLEEARRTFS